MKKLRSKWSAFLDEQHRNPTGMVGFLIGERMLRQHTPETDWSIDLLGLQATDHLLELGFGAGRALALAGQRVNTGRITGLERSWAMIRSARRRNRRSYMGQQLGLIRGDLTTLPFRKHTFDKILSIHTIYFWPDKSSLCRQLLELLKPGGKIVLIFATGYTLPPGEYVYWPLQQEAERIVEELRQLYHLDARLAYGPHSRQYNNVALIIER